MIKVEILYSYRFKPFKIVYFKNIRIAAGLVIVPASRLIERVFEPRSGKTKQKEQRLVYSESEAMFGVCVFQQTVDKLMVTHCASPLTD
jgi:hypothetical protein